MVEESARLMALLGGEVGVRPPYWEPWFGMGAMLRERFGGDYLTMAEAFGLAAVPLGGLHVDVHFNRPVERIEATGVWYGGGALRSREQLAGRPKPDFAAQLEALGPQRERLRHAGRACWMVLPWCFHAVATSMGLEAFAYACCDDRAFVAEAMAWVEARNEAAVREVILALRPDFVLYDGDCAYKTGTMIDPALMRELCEAPTRGSMGLLHQAGIPVAFHTDGRLDGVIPLLLDLGFAAVHGCEAQANDLGHLVATFGGDICLCGNMDVVFLSRAVPDAVRAAAEEMLRVGAARGRFVAGCNTSPLDYVPVENYLALVETVRHWRD